MKPFTLQEIAAACGGTYFGSEAMKTACITSVERDSRQVGEGSLASRITAARASLIRSFFCSCRLFCSRAARRLRRCSKLSC